MTDTEDFFAGRLPSGWFTGPPTLHEDADEILVVGALPEDGPAVEAFREATRDTRVAIAEEAEARFGRRVSWGVERAGRLQLFTSQATPVMTRLRLRERAVLDTLVRGGVARSRSDALAWCVKLVGRHEAAWLAELRDALAGVDEVRGEGPALL